MAKQKIVSIVGVTASGKSALGILLAQKFNGEIISCDSRQLYTGLDIGTAKVTREERELVPHHCLDIADLGKTFNVVDFSKHAYRAIEDILARGKLPILVGGSGLYSRSIVEGYGFDVPNSPRYDVLQICLMPPKHVIAPLVARRIDERLEAGMIEETKDLIARGVSASWLQSLGLEYYWNVEYIEGRITLDEYKESLYNKTMQFVKRQRTWFRKERDTIYLTDASEYLEKSMRLITKFLSRD